MTRTAAALVIGNEILTGKIDEANVAPLARGLFARGVRLQRVIVCPDEIETIARDLNALRAAHDYVITSGGIGPTHDDLTVPAVAHAFGRQVERSEEIVTLIRAFHAKRDRPVTDAHLRMAEVVTGSRLLASAEVPWPTLVVENVYVLPGVPQVFRLKLELVLEDIGGGEGFVSEAVYTQCDEGVIAPILSQLEVAHAGVGIGSYPRWDAPDHKVKVTFDGTDATQVRAAADAFVAAIPAEEFVRRS